MIRGGDHSTMRYLRQHFWTLDQLAAAVGQDNRTVERLIDARCAPGAIYVLDGDVCWSALDRDDRSAPPPGERWYSRAAAWHLRRVLAAARDGISYEQLAARIRLKFGLEFSAALEMVPGAAAAFPACFEGSAVRRAAAAATADREWEAWLDGGYGVCLRIFNGLTCVAKEAIAHAMKTALESSDYDTEHMLGLGEHLSSLILPFAPWQRPSCTPGRTIDRLLSEQDLGNELPHAGD